MTIITDATGKGYGVEVDSENRMSVEAVTTVREQHVNKIHQKYFSIPFDAIDPVGADDYFVYIENTGTTNLHVTDIRIRSTVIGTVEVHSVSGTPSYTADTDINPVNRFIGSAQTLVGTFKTDTDTTGLVNEGVVFYIRLDTADKDVHLKTSGHVIIPPGNQLAILWDTSTGALSGMISIYEDL